MTKKIIFALAGMISIVIFYILYSFLGPRFGCFLNDDSCYYKSLMRTPVKSIILGGEEYNRKIIMKYGFLKDRIFSELKNNDGSDFYRLVYLNKVLNFEKTKDYMSQCLDNETNVDKLKQCISLYNLFEPNKNIVKGKIYKFENYDDERIRIVYKKVLDYLDKIK